MQRSHVWFAMVVATSVIAAGCSVARPPADQENPERASAPGAQTPSGQPGGESAPGAQTPAGFPAGVPLPPGKVRGTGNGPGRWSVLLEVGGSAPDAQRSSVAFYVRRGFHRDSAFGVHGRGFRIMMTAENSDHSATESNLTVVVNRRP